MVVTWPGFSERVFEFAFNAEFARRNRALLAAAPSIPTQNAEKTLGYDVLFEIKRRGGAVNSIALQHKVSRLVSTESGSNAPFRALVGLPYLGFNVDAEQYNAIRDVASARLPGVEFYYCAPLFADLRSLDRYYFSSSVVENAVWIDVAAGNPIDPAGSHGMVYSNIAPYAYLLSKQPQRLEMRRPAERQRDWDQARRPNEYFEALYEVTYNAVVRAHRHARVRRRDSGVPRSVFPSAEPQRLATTDTRELLAGTAELLSRYLGMVWLVEVVT